MYKQLLVTALFSCAANMAFASLIRAPQFDVDAQTAGFGDIPRLLSISNSGPGQTIGGVSDAYGACMSVSGAGTAVYGSCSGADATIGPNGLVVPNSDNIAPPNKVSAKNSIATLGSLGINSLSDLVLIFNAIEPQNDTGGINLLDATLKFYTASGSFLGSVDGNYDFTGSGNGNFGFAFVIDAQQQAALASAIGSNAISSLQIAMEGAVARASGGADSFFVVSAGQTSSVPEPGTWVLLSSGLAACALFRRKVQRTY